MSWCFTSIIRPNVMNFNFPCNIRVVKCQNVQALSKDIVNHLYYVLTSIPHVDFIITLSLDEIHIYLN